MGANDDSADNDSQTSSMEGQKKENYYRVVGTLYDAEKNEKPDWVEEIFEVCNFTLNI